ncbi:MAG: hypothetical protein WBV85_00100 [Solirubrobacteraceae bacterium]
MTTQRAVIENARCGVSATICFSVVLSLKSFNRFAPSTFMPRIAHAKGDT